MIRRDAEDTIHSLLRGFPIVTITGPRQSGKTTLAKAIFPDKPYVSMEEPDVRLPASEDPRSFLERFPNGAVLDEVQRCPEILSYLQSIVDADGRMAAEVAAPECDFVVKDEERAGFATPIFSKECRNFLNQDGPGRCL